MKTVKHLVLYGLLLGITSTLPLASHAQQGDWLDEIASDTPTDRRIRVFTYDPNEVYTMVTRIGYQSYIEFSPQETVQTISVGERSFWQIIPANNRLFLKPIRPDVSTNMTVITNRHAYQFDIVSIPDATEAEEETSDEEVAETPRKLRRTHLTRTERDVIYVARFDYPDAKPRPTMPMPVALTPPTPAVPPAPSPVLSPPPAPAPIIASDTAPLAPIPAPVPLTPLEPPESHKNYAYTYSGADAPYEIFDNGSTTYFRYRDPEHPKPRVAILGQDGAENALAVFREGEYYAVSTVAPVLVLRVPGNTAFVYNEALTPHP